MTYRQFFLRLARFRRRRWRVLPSGRIRHTLRTHKGRVDTCPVVAVGGAEGIGAWREGMRLGLSEDQVANLICAADKRNPTGALTDLRRRMLHVLRLD